MKLIFRYSLDATREITPSDLRIEDGLASAPTLVDHYHLAPGPYPGFERRGIVSENRNLIKYKIR